MGCRSFPPAPLSLLAASSSFGAPDGSLSTKLNTYPTIKMPASLRSDGVHLRPGMAFGFPVNPTHRRLPPSWVIYNSRDIVDGAWARGLQQQASYFAKPAARQHSAERTAQRLGGGAMPERGCVGRWGGRRSGPREPAGGDPWPLPQIETRQRPLIPHVEFSIGEGWIGPHRGGQQLGA